MITKVTTATTRPRIADLLETDSTFGILLLSLAGAYLTALCAQLKFQTPLSTVPVTQQVLAVMLIAGLVRPSVAWYALGLYFVAGALGLPWYAGGGFGFRPDTTGYIIGFALAAPIVSSLIRAGRKNASTLRIVSAMSIGLAVIYLGGLLQHMVLLGQPLSVALKVAVLPFILFDAAKIAVATGIVRAARAKLAN